MLKELDVNQQEQLILKKRIAIMKDFLNELPANDPQYSIMLTLMRTDQIELDELKVHESIIQNNLVTNELQAERENNL